MLRDIQDCFISEKEVEHIHAMSLRVLSEIGVAFEHEEVLEVFRKTAPRLTATRSFCQRPW